MAARLISDEAISINGLHRRVVDIIREKNDDMIRSTREAVIEAILGTIQEIDEVMGRPTVRGHADPNLRNPVVDEDSSLNSILRRLQNQITAACILADMAHIGPAANDQEADTLNRVKQALRELFDNISPVASLNASSTGSNRDVFS